MLQKDLTCDKILLLSKKEIDMDCNNIRPLTEEELSLRIEKNYERLLRRIME